MRVLIDTEHAAVVGGVETYLRAALPRLAAAGLEVGLVAADPPPPGGGVAAGCPGLPHWSRRGRDRAGLLAELARWGPDVALSHGTADSAWEAALADAFPAVLFAHNYHGTCVSGTKCHSRPGFTACRRTLGPACLALYLPRGCGGGNPRTMLRLYAAQRRRRANLARYRAVLVASRHMAAEYGRHGVAATLLPLFPPNAVRDPTPPAPRPRSDRVLFVGRVTRLKGLSHLIPAAADAAAQLGRALTLVVAGEGPALDAAERLARRVGLPCEFPGWVGPERREAEMRAADLLAVPSLWPEPFGLVGIEAGCVGLPAAGYATGGIPDWLRPGISGESAPGDRPDPEELAAALVRALAEDGHRHDLRTGAWETAGEFGAEAHVRRLSGLLRRCAGTGAPGPGSAGSGG